MTPVNASPAQALVHTIQEALQSVEQRIRQHAYLQALEEGRLTPPGCGILLGNRATLSQAIYAALLSLSPDVPRRPVSSSAAPYSTAKRPPWRPWSPWPLPSA